ncbi:MAG: helix-turn-helix transcriptional regulator [Anaerolineales bacterium]|nr:helix-turn-helix transcriptional regulator [Anaerolineales bacterium]
MADKTKFAKWLENELETRNISQSELARQAGVTRGAINGILTGSKGPGIDLCKGIAQAFDLPPEIVFRAAGLLPPDTTVTELIQQITHLTNELPLQEQQDILEFVKLRHHLTKKRGKNATGRITKNPTIAK